MNIIISGNEDTIKYIDSASHSDKEELKPSYFNYMQPTRDGVIVYNTLYNTLVRLSDIEYKKLSGKMKVGMNLRKEFIAQGLLVRNSTDELSGFLKWALIKRKEDKHYLSLNITTTLKCNAHCPYCYENGVRKNDFPSRRYSKLATFIKSNIHIGDKVALNWFGGEPLLNPSLIDYITTELKKDKIEFSSYIISNGSLINKTMITRKFKKWKVKDVQITLDGTKDNYEKCKSYLPPKKNIFEKILNTIKLLAENNINVHIRLNIDRNNMSDILSLIDIIEDNFNGMKFVTYYPAFLTGVSLDLSDTEKISFLTSVFQKMRDPKNMNMSKRFFSIPKYHPCMRNDVRSLSIDVDGRIYSCEHYVGRADKSFSSIDSFDTNANKKRITLRLPETCKKCVFLPKCMGGCGANRDTNDEPCMIEKYLLQGYMNYLAKF